MLTKEFYTVIDAELSVILTKYKDDPFLKNQKGDQKENQAKSYALLIWFLEFYAKKNDYLSYITDSNSLVRNKNGDKSQDKFKDTDASCDVIFENIDTFGNKIFYIVQSKWNNSNNSEGEIERTEVAKALNDFETILRGDTQKVNEKLAKKLEALYEHLKNNGEVKFIFLCLCKSNPKAEENIKSFLLGQEKTKVEIIDIERLKIDYIDRKFKKIAPINPLENYIDPKEVKVHLKIERLDKKSGSFIKIEKPFDAYLFLVRPKIIYELFERYNFYLFYKNVRNPLIQSDFNKEIEHTALEEPAYFWYYNNGITAITYSPFPVVRPQAENLELNGLQIINGAQTVYSIYRAYKNASKSNRERMDSEILLTLRLLKSGGEKFDVNVTRFTNSQNPVQDRDFCANHPVQERLQREFYNTKFWYEKRRGEFREEDEDVKKMLKERGIKIVENSTFAYPYLLYHLSSYVNLDTKFNFIFLSKQEDKDGLFEIVFNEETNYEDMLCAFQLNRTLISVSSHMKFVAFNDYLLLPLFKTVFTRYMYKKINNHIVINKYIIKLYEENKIEIIEKHFMFLDTFLGDLMNSLNADYDATALLMAIYSFEAIKKMLEDYDFSISDIENIIVPEDLPPF